MLVELGEVADLNSLTQEALRDIVEIAVRLRDQARHERRFAEADRLRDALQRLGIEMRDQPAGAHQFPASPH
jgi:cysteinyl-tRNA synthetase